MSRTHEWTPEQQAGWDEWLATRPAVIQEMARKYPPNVLYRIDSGHRVTIYSYSEGRTVTVNVSGKYNFVAFERRVFGIPIDELVECELPTPDETLGTLDIPIETVRELMGRGVPPQGAP